MCHKSRTHCPTTTSLKQNTDDVTHAATVDPDRLHSVGLTLVNQTSCREKWGGLIDDSHICSHPAGSASCMVTLPLLSLSEPLVLQNPR